MFMSTVRQVKLEVRPLFLPQLVQLTSLLKPGLSRIKVSNADIIPFLRILSIFVVFLAFIKKLIILFF